MSPFAPPRARSSASQSRQGSTSRRPGFRDAWERKEVLSIGIAVCGVIAGLVRWNGGLVNLMAEIGAFGWAAFVALIFWLFLADNLVRFVLQWLNRKWREIVIGAMQILF